MKYSYTWLKELSGTKKTPQQLAELLTMRAFELEEIKTEGKETQMEFAVLPNRAHDVLSHIGMAREICAIEGRSFILKETFRNFLKVSFRSGLEIKIQGKNLCKRYIGAVVENIKVVPAPKLMRERLLACGVKLNNNVVDIINYVMLETGQPLHAFDAEKTTGNIIVRKAKKGEKIKLLDEKEYELNESDLVIADSEKPIALAGVMGGFDSSVTNKTTSIILESANFNSTSIRKTRTRHNITTESSYRLEREIDPNLAELGVARAIELLKKFGGAEVNVMALADIYPRKVKSWAIKLDTDYANLLLGENIPGTQMKKILENLGLEIFGLQKSKLLNVEIPTRRIDLKTQEDLIEEIGRIYGYENIKEQTPCVSVETPVFNRQRELEDKLRDVMAGLEFSEVMNYSFYGMDDIEKCNLRLEEHIEVENPMNPEQQYMRRTLVPGILKNIRLNLKNFEDVQIFEVGKKFKKINGQEKEFAFCLAAISNNSVKGDLFPALKGKLEALFSSIGLQNINYKPQTGDRKYWHPTKTAVIFANNEKIGKIGEVSPLVLKKYNISRRVAIFGLKIEKFVDLAKKERAYSPISKFPSVYRDISMFAPKSASYAEIQKEIQKAGGELVKNIELFDIFKDSMAIRVEIGSDKKTLTTQEIDAVMKKIISALEKDLKVKVRK